MIVKLRDLIDVYENDIKKGVKNKKKLFEFEKCKMEYLVSIKKILENGSYDGGKYNVFLVYKPKVRVIMSQGIYDKVINHYITKYILIPKLSKYLCNENVATRKNMGTNYAINKVKSDIECVKRNGDIYILKMDIKKYFYNISHKVLKELIKKDLEEDEYKLICTIIDSTNRDYINNKVKILQSRVKEELPIIRYGYGLPIGNMSSQFFAIYYLSGLHHMMRHDLHIKYFTVYMDDYLILHNSKEYLKLCNIKIINELKKYEMEVNKKKTFITNSKSGVCFLGYIFKVINNKTIIKLSRNTKHNIIKGIKRNKYLYKMGKVDFSTVFASIETYKYSYKFVSKKYIEEIFSKYW